MINPADSLGNIAVVDTVHIRNDCVPSVIARHRDEEASRRLASIPGVEPITASAIVASVADASQFKLARHFAAWRGLTPRSHSTGGKERRNGLVRAPDKAIPYLPCLRWREPAQPYRCRYFIRFLHPIASIDQFRSPGIHPQNVDRDLKLIRVISVVEPCRENGCQNSL